MRPGRLAWTAVAKGNVLDDGSDHGMHLHVNLVAHAVGDNLGKLNFKVVLTGVSEKAMNDRGKSAVDVQGGYVANNVGEGKIKEAEPARLLQIGGRGVLVVDAAFRIMQRSVLPVLRIITTRLSLAQPREARWTQNLLDTESAQKAG